MLENIKISAVVLAHQDSDTLKKSIKSLKFANEIILLWDINSPQNPPKQLAVNKIIFHPLNQDFAKHRNYVLPKAKFNWVLFLDSDEIISSSLALEITSLPNKNTIKSFLIPRRDIFYSKTLHSGETGQTSIIRLMHKKYGKFIRPVHEKWHTTAPCGQLKHSIIHIKSNFTQDFLSKIAYYSEIDSQVLSQEGKPFSYWRTILNPIAKFFSAYIIKKGFMDNTLGLFHAYIMSVQSLSVRIYQYQQKQK